ncbi:MAG: type ISP restriction/modification enzyme [Bacteroidales bacterium]
MCVIGNPPYAVSSTNKSEWIENLTSDYKKDMTERNIQPLSDDYIKFIRYGQHYIDKNGSGVLAYISNNSFIDGIIHRQMRKNLLETFDKIYILDLHGNARKKEVCPDGSPDQNVFDIMQGVSINIFLKIGKKKSNELGKIFHFDLYGKRDFKYDFLNKNDFNKIHWNVLKSEKPYYFFVDKDLDLLKNFNNGINLRNLFIENSMGIATGKDSELVDFTKDELREKFKLEPIKFNYRPFDLRFTVFDNNILQRARFNLMSNYLFENIGLNIVRQSKQKGVEVLLNKTISNRDLITNHTYNFPLYLYPETNSSAGSGQAIQQTIEQSDTSASSVHGRKPNLNLEIVNQIAENLGLTFTYEKETTENTFAPIDILDYIYAVLHSPTYREKYKEFLKIDFPRVPYPKRRMPLFGNW